MRPTTEAAVEFPAAETVAKIRELKQRIAELTKERAAAERKLDLTRTNSAVIELEGRDPVAAVRDAVAGAQLANSRLTGAQAELAKAFLTEHARFVEAKAAIWREMYESFVIPRVEQLRKICAEFEAVVDEFASTLNNAGEVGAVAEFDAGIERWNKLVEELGGPANAMIEDGSLRLTLANSLVSNLRVPEGFEAAAEKLRKAASLARPR